MKITQTCMQGAFALSLAISPLSAAAQVSAAEMIDAGMPPGLANFASAVSSSEGDWDSVNQYGCAGAFQFCPDTRVRYHPSSLESFLSSPTAQVSAYRRYMADEWQLATRNGFDELIGSQVCWGGSCRTITQSSIIKGCQFGCGYHGALGRYYRTGDCNQARDGNGVSVCAYLIRGAGYDVSGVTGTAEPGPVLAGGIGTCFDRDLMNSAGLRVTSPFGVDRTGRASAGYHLGLDLVNDEGEGSQVFAGVPGTVVFSAANRTNSVFVETPDGRQRVGYLHGQARRVAQGDRVLPDTVVITQGDAGTPGATHLHLEVHVAGEIMAALGEDTGRAWPLEDRETFFGSKQSSGLSGASLAGAAPQPFYVVNPETYLHRRLPFRESLLSVEQYARQGFSRPDGLTLEPTCAPGANMLDGGMMSSNGGHNVMGGVAEAGVALLGNPQTSANLASSNGRDAAIQYGLAAIGSARNGSNMGRVMRSQIAVMTGLILTTE